MRQSQPFRNSSRPIRVGVSGTGFIAKGVLAGLSNSDDFDVGKVLTRRQIANTHDVDQGLLTRSIDELIEESTIIVECCGDVFWASEVVERALAAGRPVVTMGTEFHVTVGSYFCGKGYLTEAEGDQPGCLAAHVENLKSMGFKPMVFGNIKGFLNHHPIEAEMKYWSDRNGISLSQTISFTDGTKLQMEQAFVANGLGGGLACRGMLGLQSSPLEVAGAQLGRKAKELGMVISDYVLDRNLPAGVFVVAEHPYEKASVLRYLKLGDGPFYTLLRPYHLCHLEVMNTLRRVASGGPPLLNNSDAPRVTVAAVVKRPLPAGHLIGQAVGGYDVRGEATMIAEAGDAVPIGLLDGARVVRKVEPGATLTWADVEVRDGVALRAALSLRDGSVSLPNPL